jgi:hypothetical protein
MEEEIEFGPERLRGEQQARFGFGRGRRVMTPSELAAWRLNQALAKYPEFTREARQSLQDEFIDMTGLRTMNMKVLAAVLSFLNKNQPIPDNFHNNIIVPYIRQLLPSDLDSDERNRLIIRFKAEMLTYMRAIDRFRGE